MRRFILVLSIVAAPLAGFGPAAAEKAKDTTGRRAGSTLSSEEVRDWSKIDTNRDGYIEPEEMEKYLQAAWEHRGKATTANEPVRNDKNDATTQH